MKLRFCWKEILLLLLQIFMFYVYPALCGPTDVFLMVFMIFGSTFVLPFLLGLLSPQQLRWLAPVIVPLLFLPTLPIYYNSSALIYAVWFFVLSAGGVGLGSLLRWASRH